MRRAWVRQDSLAPCQDPVLLDAELVARGVAHAGADAPGWLAGSFTTSTPGTLTTWSKAASRASERNPRCQRGNRLDHAALPAFPAFESGGRGLE